ncbi:hypothetical protein MMC09_002086 [Bachmanniomyces sp. S44760]|nr:hypothetical protein [Bachmanniomyces sp. S44760]
MDNVFFDALLQVGRCNYHTRLDLFDRCSSIAPYTFQRRGHKLPRSFTRAHRTFRGPSTRKRSSLAVPVEISRNEYLHMVDYYSDSYHTQAHSIASEPIYEPPPTYDGNFMESAESLVARPASEIQETEDTQEYQAVKLLVTAIEDEQNSHEDIFRLYQALPRPGVAYLADDVRWRLLTRLSAVERRTEKTMLRYLSIIDDMKRAGLLLNRHQWSTAIAFAGRCFSKITATEVESALRLWMEMEQEAGVLGSNVTFNILFGIAVKAEKFVLAEMILEEMEARKLEVNRYAHVGRIYYQGSKGDGDGVRRAYRDFVQSGQIVDTVVLNCVIASLIRAGELPAAELVFWRMKNMYEKYGGVRISSPGDEKALGRSLNEAARNFKFNPNRRKELQNEQYLAPNPQTYIIFVEHHVARTGEIRPVATLLNEMLSMGFPLQGRLFLELFKGFANHGGVRYTSWTKERLESTWSAFRTAIDEGLEDVFVAKWTVIWALRAFGACYGKAKALEIWDEIKSMWDPDEREHEIVNDILVKIKL